MSASILAVAMVLDAILGEPRQIYSRIPHPAVLIGRLIAFADRRFNTGGFRTLKGIVLVLGLLGLACLIGGAISALPFGWIIEIVLVAMLLAHRSLADHVRDVARALVMSTSEGRRAVARIVGRDTAEMEDAGIARAAIESAAENLSDGVVAPALFYLVFGLPGILAYKFVNTADSMIGYRTDRHASFGWAAARLDDLLNLLPARATAALIAILSGNLGVWRGIARDAGLHRSPNAGWPEAAMARALDVSLAGPRSYDGEMRDFPFVHPEGRRDADAADIRNAVGWLWRTWWALWLLVLAVALVT